MRVFRDNGSRNYANCEKNSKGNTAGNKCFIFDYRAHGKTANISGRKKINKKGIFVVDQDICDAKPTIYVLRNRCVQTVLVHARTTNPDKEGERLSFLVLRAIV